MSELTTSLENIKPEQIISAAPLKKEETITISKSVLETLMKRIEGLERGEVAILDEVEQKKIATMRVWNKKLVVGWSNVWKSKDKDTDEEEKLLFKLHLKNKDQIEEETVSYLEFLREAEKVNVEILSMARTDEVKVQGMTTVKEVEGYATRDTGIRVPVKVIIPHYEAVVKLPSGHELKVDVQYLNG